MIIGISIDENYAYVSTNLDENVMQIPFAIGKNLVSNNWFIGDEAKNENIDSTDIVIDKLYYILENDGNARIGDKSYEAEELTSIFLKHLILKFPNVEYVTIVVRNCNIKILEKLHNALMTCIEDKNKCKVTTFSEAFISYIKSHTSEYYDNPIALFNFTEKALNYYELIRYKSADNLEYWKVNTKEHLSLPLDLLTGDTGKRVCDNLLCEFAKHSIQEVAYNNIILSGLGFVEASSYREFMTYVCGITEVNTDINFFAKAAVMLSRDLMEGNFSEDIVLMTDARTDVALRVNVRVSATEDKLELVKPGSEWFDIDEYSFNIIVDNEKELRFEYLKVIEGIIKEFVVDIPGSDKLRDDKTNEYEVSLKFLQQNLLQVTLTDIGFGEFYESQIKSSSREIEL
ncbi:MAG: hypothetical protein J6O09_03255 [Lachnospiraceae bacterium]|nr:hypothetical protein [Lachnospiraceae bacterium]